MIGLRFRSSLPPFVAREFDHLIAQLRVAFGGIDIDRIGEAVVTLDTGDVDGPGVSTDKAIARFSGTTGKLIQNSTPIVEDDGRITTVTNPTSAQDVATKAYVDQIRTTTCGITIDGGGSAITTGIKGDLYVPLACTITANHLLADQSGSIVVDIWKDTYGNFPPTDADSITASAPPTISSATKSTDSTLTGWTTAIAAGTTLRFNVDSCTSITRAQLQLTVTI